MHFLLMRVVLGTGNNPERRDDVFRTLFARSKIWN
jgi:hypothetical protein